MKQRILDGWQDLNAPQMNDIWNMFQSLPWTMVSRDSFLGMLLSCPPEIVITTLNWRVSDDELQVLLETNWMTFYHNFYTWWKLFGICPWYYKKVRGSPHAFPCIPPFGTGIIKTRWDTGKRFQQFGWVWTTDDQTDNPNPDIDPHMHFEVGMHPPLLSGRITTPLASLITDFRTASIIRDAIEFTTTSQKFIQHMFERNPPRNKGTDEEYMTTYEAFGEGMVGSIMAEREGLQQQKNQIQTEELKQIIWSASQQNYQRAQRVVHSETHAQTASRHQAMNNGVEANHLPLPPYWTYKPAAVPRVHANLQEALQRLDVQAAAVMDYPLDMIRSPSGGTRSANRDLNLRFVNEKIKQWNHIYTTVTKKIFLLWYKPTLVDGTEQILNRARGSKLDSGLIMTRKQLELFMERNVTVQMSCTPLTSLDSLTRLAQMGVLQPKAFKQHAMEHFALPLSDMTPDGTPLIFGSLGGRAPETPKDENTID